MRRMIVTILVLLAMGSSVGCAATTVVPKEVVPVVTAPVVVAPIEDVHDFLIEIVGFKGNKFSGTYMTVMADGSSTSHSVEGVIPATTDDLYKLTDAATIKYATRGTMVSCVFQLQEEKGVIAMIICRDGVEIKWEETSAAYGVISVCTP